MFIILLHPCLQHSYWPRVQPLARISFILLRMSRYNITQLFSIEQQLYKINSRYRFCMHCMPFIYLSLTVNESPNNSLWMLCKPYHKSKSYRNIFARQKNICLHTSGQLIPSAQALQQKLPVHLAQWCCVGEEDKKGFSNWKCYPWSSQ